MVTPNLKPGHELVFIGLGSNLDRPVEQLKSARLAISVLPLVEEVSFSSLYLNPPMGPQDQPDYVNAVMAVTTGLPPLTLLASLQTIESEHGRVRTCRWGARTLDLDILLYGPLEMSVPELTIPHPGLTERAFVLCPLYEIAPELIIPGKGKIADILAQCPTDQLKKLT
ncbi:MAG: 2-amino-4-hydroxy-6-hydroxymethyldihydropteridine diphosphokinase [Methylobacter sp.]|nr:MAG: 2-amino-4-hydroxy-6-hydroxymethyldihydropteridine diphosphokinase [Methylobacter sp.]PPD05612.1 MAG: 2-amino-4-hydroxy-6-hydroxymethyldihydropteridine diphosphokinase [Methylobacter sp.]PPD19245.1 MAG: 2-amino-4-hydroxy-6-hydroxymethyldihydropteridine diphosphokinase [Methylobacter sp.]